MKQGSVDVQEIIVIISGGKQAIKRGKRSRYKYAGFKLRCSTFTSDFLSVLIMKRSSCDRKKTLPLFPGDESSLKASLPQMDIM